jgi:hypothetical protein
MKSEDIPISSAFPWKYNSNLSELPHFSNQPGMLFSISSFLFEIMLLLLLSFLFEFILLLLLLFIILSYYLDSIISIFSYLFVFKL